MRTDTGFDLMERLLPHMAVILDDADAKEAITELRKHFATMPAGSMMASLLPYFIGRHRDRMYEIVAALCDCTVEEAKAMPFHDAVKALNEGFTEDMCLFFTSCLRMARCM